METCLQAWRRLSTWLVAPRAPLMLEQYKGEALARIGSLLEWKKTLAPVNLKMALKLEVAVLAAMLDDAYDSMVAQIHSGNGRVTAQSLRSFVQDTVVPQVDALIRRFEMDLKGENLGDAAEYVRESIDTLNAIKADFQERIATFERSYGVCRNDAGIWTLTYQGSTIRLPDMEGLRQLQELLRAPGRLIDAPTLAGKGQVITRHDSSGGNDLDDDQGEQEGPALAGEGFQGQLLDRSNSGALVDDRGRELCKRRLQELNLERSQAEKRGDTHRLSEIDAETREIGEYLRNSQGLDRRERKFASDGQRARINVTKNIQRAVRLIGKRHPALGKHLQETISTGLNCVYFGDFKHPVDWHF